MPDPKIGQDPRSMEERIAQKEADRIEQERLDAQAEKKREYRAGNAAVLAGRAKREAEEGARLAAREAKVAELLTIEIAALPPDIRDNAFVLNALRNKANAQAALSAQYERIHRLEPGTEASNEALKTAKGLFELVQAATTDVLAKWPKTEENKPFQRVPQSVVDWLMNRESYEGSVVVQEETK